MFLPQITKFHLKDAWFLFPLWPSQNASSAQSWCVCADSMLRGVWVWNGTQISQLNSVGFDIALISCCMLHTMKSLLMKLLSPLSLPPALHKACPTQLKIRTYKICTFFQEWHKTVFCFDSSILCSIVFQTVLFFPFRCSLSYFEEKLHCLVVHIQHDYWTQKVTFGISCDVSFEVTKPKVYGKLSHHLSSL